MAESSPYSTLVEDFSAGYNDGAEPNRLKAGSTPDGRNAWFHSIDFEPRRVTMGRRPGDLLVTPTAMTLGAAVDGLVEYRRIAQAAKLLAVCAGRLYEFDDVDTFVEKTAPDPAPAVFSAGRRCRTLAFKENALLFDGTVNQRWNGTDVLGLGTAAGTTAPVGTAVAGPGVTGEYEAFAVVYDPLMDHESSPSPTSNAVTCTNQQRQWTQPTWSPGAEYTHWRVYVRRRDTSELNFYRAATDVIGNATITESTSDTARRDIGPQPNENDPPPGAFAVLGVWKGYGIGILADSDEYVVSKLGDLQSWHPRNAFAVDRGAGEPLTTARPYGSDFLLQKAHASWRLKGDTLPLTPDPIHSSYGNVNQDAGGEVDSLYFGWDREKGPYVTDTVNWNPLSTGRLKRLLDLITRSALDRIQFGHSEKDRIVFWAVPVNGSSRLRTLLPYHYELKTWLPPITGLEYAAFAAASDPTTAAAILYVGDAWGRLFKLFTGNREGVPTSPASTVSGMATGATSDTLTDDAAQFYTEGDGLVGLPVAVRSPAGVWQWRRIASNTATEITLDLVNDAPFSPVPSAGWTYYVGGIEWWQWTHVVDDFDPFEDKQTHHLFVEARSANASAALEVQMRVNGATAIAETLFIQFATGSGGIWGDPGSLWGTAVWGATSQQPKKQSLERTNISMQFRFANFAPDERFVLTAWGRTTDPKPRRKAAN